MLDTLPVLEPLCRATEQTLKAIELFDNDYLELDLDDEGKRFIATVATYESASEVDGVEIHGKWIKQSPHGASFNAHRWVRRIPERKELGYGKFRLGGTDFTALVIHHVWPKDKIIFANEEAELFYTFLIQRFFSQTKSSIIAARFKVNGERPEMPADYISHPDPDLRLAPFQEVAMMTSVQQEASALFMEQGTGKTPIVVNRINLEGHRKRIGKLPAAKKGMYRALIICPKQVRLNWETEFRRFSVWPGKTAVLRGSLVTRTKCLLDGVRTEDDCHWSACIMSVDSLASTFQALRRVPWDLVVFDESHYAKNPQSKRFKFLSKLRDQGFVRAKTILTGTPIANTIFDLWAQLEVLGEGLSGFQTFANFRGFHGKFENAAPAGSTPIQRLVGLKALPLIQERLSRLAFMIRKDEANLGLPDKLYDIEEVAMTPKQTEVYRKIASQMVVEIEQLLSDESKTLSVDHVLTKLLRLAQITSGHVKWDSTDDPDTGDVVEGKVEQIDEDNPKVQAIINMLQDPARDPRGKTIIWCCFIEDMRVLSQALHDAGINHVGYHKVTHPDYKVRDSREAEQAMNLDPDCKVFIGNPESAGEGLNIIGYDREDPDRFDTFTDHEIYMSCNWSAVQRSQSEDRAHRRGTRSPVRITDLMVPGTIDEEIRARVLQKRQTALMIQDVKEILERIVDLKVDNG